MSTLTPYEIEMIWRSHKHSPAAGTRRQLTGDSEEATCPCGERIISHEFTAGSVQYIVWRSDH